MKVNENESDTTRGPASRNHHRQISIVKSYESKTYGLWNLHALEVSTEIF